MMDESNQLNHDDESTTDHSGVSDSSKRKNTLKDRIKRAMASNEQASQSHANSVLTAASALASLGVDTPPSSDHGSIEKSGDEKHAALMTVVSVPSAGKSNVVTRSLPSRLENDVPMTFPQKLMEVLSNKEITDIITWLPHGKGFIILQKRKFASDIMPLYFKHSKFTSFTRKLNRWGYTRITRGPETGAYYHKLFQRDNHLLCMQMHCQSIKSSSNNMSPGASPRTAALDSPCVMSAMTALRLDESAPALPSLMPQERSIQFSGFNNVHAPPASPAQTESNTEMSLMQMSQGNATPSRSAMERVFFRQQELLQEEQKFRMLANHHQAGQQQQEFRLTHQRHPHDSALQIPQQVRPNNSNQPMPVEKILGLNTSSSQQHPRVIQAAMNALQGYNDRAYLTMLMTKEHEHQKAVAAAGNTGAISQAEIQSRVHAAMQARMQQLEQYNRHQMHGLKNSLVNPAISGLKTDAPLISQNHVAQLHKEINQQHDGLPTNSDVHDPQRKSSSKSRRSGVRRASAA